MHGASSSEQSLSALKEAIVVCSLHCGSVNSYFMSVLVPTASLSASSPIIYVFCMALCPYLPARLLSSPTSLHIVRPDLCFHASSN